MHFPPATQSVTLPALRMLVSRRLGFAGGGVVVLAGGGGSESVDIRCGFFRPVYAVGAPQEMLFERGEFGFVRDHAQMVPLKIIVRNMARHLRFCLRNEAFHALLFRIEAYESFPQKLGIHIPVFMIGVLPRDYLLTHGYIFRLLVAIDTALTPDLAADHRRLTEEHATRLKCEQASESETRARRPVIFAPQ